MIVDDINFEIITTRSKWNNLLKVIGSYDFYHTYDYHFIERPIGGSPVIIKYVENQIIIAIPLIIRKISGTNYHDATSVYGYGGPISKNIPLDYDNTLFIEKLQTFFEKNKIISVFSRLHPYFNKQDIILKNYGDIIKTGKVVNINLNLNLDLQNKNYHKRLRTYVNMARRNCIVKKLETKKELREFIGIYHETLARVNANNYFYFDEDYFNELLNNNNYLAEILVVKYKETGETIAGSLFITTNKIVQYHLSGTRAEFSHLAPTKLMIDEMRILATNRGTKFFNLGGGLGGKTQDSLFKFKSAFSKDFRDFSLWKLIVDKEIYDELAYKHRYVETSFFPKYRFNDNTIATTMRSSSST